DALGWPARRPAHAGVGPTLALRQRPVLGAQWRHLCLAVIRDASLAANRAGLLAYLPGCLGGICPLCHVPPPAGARRILPIQRASAAQLFRSDLHPGATVDSYRAGDVPS